MKTEILELPRRDVLLQHGAHVGYVGPSVATVRLLKAARAQGYVLLHHGSQGAWQTFRLQESSLAGARDIAARVAKSVRRKVLLGELLQVAGGVQVIRSLASYEVLSRAELLARATTAAGAVAEVVKARASDPYKPREFDRLTDALARDLNKKAVPTFEKTVERVVDEAKIDWATATEEQLERFSKKLAVALGVAAGVVWKSIRTTVVDASVGMATSARSAFVKTHELRVDRAISLTDKRAVTRAAMTNAHYVREYATGQMSPRLSVKARKIVQAGIEKGASSRVIGAQLHWDLSMAAGGQTEAYYRMAASAMNARSREFSSLRSMQDAGVEVFEISAVLDKNTTEICRFLHGKTFSVGAGLERFAAADALEDPTDIKYEMPWLREKKIRGGEHDGKMGIYVPGRTGMTRVAVVEKGGFGQRDTIGTYSSTMSARGMERVNVGPPSYHGH
jgi:hypothetical protein